MSDYHPIDCSFYDRLEAAAVQKKFCHLEYSSDLGEILQAGGVIKDLYIREGAEFLKLSTGPEIRLDRLIRLDQHYLPGKESSGRNHCSP